MKLDEKQLDMIGKFLDEKWPHPRECPICKNKDWNMGNILFSILDFSKNPFMPRRGRLLPVVEFMCTNCGYTLFFNAIQMGILEPPPEEDKNE